MTTTPNFDDLTPPDELMRELAAKARSWSEATTWEALRDAYRAGARHGWEQARKTQQWPEPICDRPPTEADGNDDGEVQYLSRCGQMWWPGPWQAVAYDGAPWLHSPNWQPRQPSLQEQALAAWERASFGKPGDRDLIRRALEQAGEGQA